jgi:tetratricopeptide (TPR) repeat protein
MKRKSSWWCGAVAVFGCASGHAADCGPEKATASMSEAVYYGVDEATKLIADKKMDQAIEKLNKLADNGSDFDKAVVNYNLGFAHSSKSDYANAAKAFAKAIALKALPQQQHQQLQFNLGQLYVVAGQHEEGIKTLQDYLANACTPPPAEAHIFLANALIEKKRYKEAVPQIDLALSKARAPNQTWLEMKLAVNYELKDFKACAASLVQLIGIAPTKPDYWKQLSTMFFEMKEDMEAVAVLAVAERQGFIDKPNERKNLYNVYMMLDLPFKAGLLLQDAIDKTLVPASEENLEDVANAWINARESARAEASLKKLAAASEKGEFYYKLGAMYGDDERWKESRDMLAKSLQKGGIKRPGEAWTRIAVAEHNLKNTSAAVAALQKAMGYEDSRKQAGAWLRHLTGQVAATQ